MRQRPSLALASTSTRPPARELRLRLAELAAGGKTDRAEHRRQRCAQLVIDGRDDACETIR
jgi:hypothetical protein